MFNDEVKNNQKEIDMKIQNVKVELKTEIRALHNAVNLLLETRMNEKEHYSSQSVDNPKDQAGGFIPNLLPGRINLLKGKIR